MVVQAKKTLGMDGVRNLGGDISKKMHLHARHLRLEHPATKAILVVHCTPT